MDSIEAHLILGRIEDLQNAYSAGYVASEEWLHSMLEYACELSLSTAGFVALVKYSGLQEPRLTLQVVKNFVFAGQAVPESAEAYAHAPEGAAFYGSHYLLNLATEVIVTKKPVLHNDPYHWQQLPHYKENPVRNFIALPLMFRGKVIAVMGLANCCKSYHTSQISALSPYFSTCAMLLGNFLRPVGVEIDVAGGKSIPAKNTSADPVSGFTQLTPEVSAHAQLGGLLNTLQEITQRESKLRDIINNLTDVIWSASLDDTILYYVNEACERLYGYPSSQFYTDRLLWFKVIHPEDAPQVLANHHTLQKDGFVEQEYRIILPSGEIKWILNRAWIIKDQHGNPVRMDGITKDATIRRKATEQLRNALEKEHALNVKLSEREEELASNEEALILVNQQLYHSIQRLVKREADLNRAQHLAKIGNFEWDQQAQVVTLSDEIADIYEQDLNGKTPDEVNAFFSTVIHPNDRAKVEEFMSKVFSGRKPSGDIQYRIVTKSGQTKFISSQLDKVEKTAAEEVIRFFGIIQDVTESVLSLQKLTEEKRRFELALWAGDLGLWDWNITSGIVTYNQRWAEMIGYTLEEIELNTDAWIKLIHPEDLEATLATVQEHLRGKTPFFQSEHRLKSKSGEWIWVQDSGKVMKWDANGKPLRAIGTHKDITAKKIAEEELRKLALVAQKTENGVVITDANGLTEWVNEGFTRITGFTLEEMKGKKPGHLLQGPGTDPATVRLMHEKISKGQEFHTEILNYSKTGEKYWLRLDVQPIVDKAGRLQQFIAIQSDITKRKQVEQQLNFQANILRNVKDSIIVTDLQGKVIYYNQGAEAIFGYTADEMIGHELVPLYPEKPDAAEREKTRNKLRSGNSYSGEWLARHKDNRLIWIEFTTTLMVDEKGEPVGLIGVTRDITSRKKAEEDLRKSEAYLESIFDATVQSYFLLDSSYRIIKFNKVGADAVKKIHGKDPQVGESILLYADLHAVEDFKKNVQKAFAGEKVTTVRELLFPSGKQLWFEVQYLPARNAEQEVYGVAFVSLDITHRKTTEIALLKSYQEIQNIKSALYTSACVSVTDVKGNIIEVNEAFCLCSGYSREEMLGNTHKLINSGFHKKEFFINMWKTISIGKPWRGEIKNRAKDGSFYWVDTSITPVKDENGKIEKYLSVRYVITERKKAEEDREILVKNLTTFAFMTAHNLRGPLARILGLVSLFNKQNPSDEMNGVVVEKLHISAKELDSVIYKMIDTVNLSDLK